jgi:hypothetical protein
MANTEPAQALDRSRKGYAQTPFLRWRNQALLPTFPAAKEFLFRVLFRVALHSLSEMMQTPGASEPRELTRRRGQ